MKNVMGNLLFIISYLLVEFFVVGFVVFNFRNYIIVVLRLVKKDEG